MPSEYEDSEYEDMDDVRVRETIINQLWMKMNPIFQYVNILIKQSFASRITTAFSKVDGVDIQLSSSLESVPKNPDFLLAIDVPVSNVEYGWYKIDLSNNTDYLTSVIECSRDLKHWTA